jgi:hypothetical protein
MWRIYWLLLDFANSTVPSPDTFNREDMNVKMYTFGLAGGGGPFALTTTPKNIATYGVNMDGVLDWIY